MLCRSPLQNEKNLQVFSQKNPIRSFSTLFEMNHVKAEHLVLLRKSQASLLALKKLYPKK
jgi:hypothetical protein